MNALTPLDDLFIPTTLAENAKFAVTDYGLWVFALGERSKTPDSQESPNGFKSSTNDLDKVENIWSRKPNDNIGVDCGSSDVAVFDFDRQEDIPAWALELKTLKIKTSRGLHVYTRGSRRTQNMYNPQGLHIGELKSQGGYVIFNSSVHPSGALYQIIDDSPIAPTPDNRIEELTKHAPKDNTDVIRNEQGLIPRGSIHPWMKIQAGKLRSIGLGGEALENALLNLVQSNCQGPIDTSKVAAMAQSFTSLYQAGVPADLILDQKPQAQSSTTTLTPVSEVKARRVRWLWKNKVPAGKITIFSGEPDKGKSLCTLDIAARLSTGRPMYGETEGIQGEVILAASEDDMGDTIRPRLEAAGADLNKVFIMPSVILKDGTGNTVSNRLLQLDTDIKQIEGMLNDHPNVRLIIFDPLNSFLGNTSTFKDIEVRRVLTPLKDLADRTGTTIIGIMHNNKSIEGSAIHRIGGSVAFTALSRAVYTFCEDPKDSSQNLMLRVKGNLARKSGGFIYKTTAKNLIIENEDEYVPYVEWLGTTDKLASDLVLDTDKAPLGRVPERKLSASEWLTQWLTDNEGWDYASDVEKQSQKEGHTLRTLERVKKALNIISTREGRRWKWHLPNFTPQSNNTVNLEKQEVETAA